MWLFPIPYPVFFGSRTFEKLVPTPLVEFQGWGPTLLSFFKAVRHWKLQWQVLRLVTGFFMFFSSLPGMKISCDVPEMGWSMLKPEDGWRLICINTRLVPVEADFQAHPFQADPLTFGGASLWSVLQWNPVVAITILSKDDADNTVLVLVLLFPRFTTHTRQRKTFFLR